MDVLNLGTSFFEVIDLRTNQPIYSRGFASMYGEWEATDEAKTGTRTFHESLRFPWPKSPVQVVLKKRGKDNLFREIWTTRVDPSSPAVNAADVAPAGKVWTVFENGPPTEKVDLVILGEAYLRRILRNYASYYNKIRTHRSLDKDAPAFRSVQRVGTITSYTILGGLHHHYVRV